MDVEPLELSEKEQEIYDLVLTSASKFGFEGAIERFQNVGMIESSEMASKLRRVYRRGIEQVAKGGPVIKDYQYNSWYPGAQKTDPCWSYFREQLLRKEDFPVDELNKATDTIVGLTPQPNLSDEPRQAKGLVVGFVQSGKTTNFTAVAAKVADLDYRMVIVLAGVHNSLRSQTQKRLEKALLPNDGGRWITITGRDEDFDLVKIDDDKSPNKLTAASQLRNNNRTLLLVVKKNQTILRKLNQWLDTKQARKVLENNFVLVIDDEADQASVQTKTINPLIRELLGLMPRATYIAYTATPFANVFIDPGDNDDLYPRDFIYPLPQPDGYFGPDKLFGLSPAVDSKDNVKAADGYDMIRSIPEEDEFLYRPKTKAETDSFVPTVTDELKDAVRWFILATAARWHRDGPGNSSMLIHTSFKTVVHRAYKPVLEHLISGWKTRIKNNDPTIWHEFKSQWEYEIDKVDAADWGRVAERFDDIEPLIPKVLDDCRIVIDNSESEYRLDYEEKDVNTVIAIGGNTLSRGITLEGLVSSLFLRPSNTYDTLLQIGRWFGFRKGYEDLPRLWTTDYLKSNFRHLALVENEMRSDMEIYEMQNQTPVDAAVSIRTHPSLRITAKMGAAAPKWTSYSGARIQVRFYEREDQSIIEANWAAGERLLQSAQRRISKEDASGSDLIIYRGVDVSFIKEFLDDYDVLPEQSDLDTGMINKYIQQQNDMEELQKWNVILRSGTGAQTTFAGHEIQTVQRSPLGKEGELKSVADIGTLMVPQDIVADLPDISTTEARREGEAGMKRIRNQRPETKGAGLLVLYPIDKDSEPTNIKSRTFRTAMDAPHHILGVGIVFPWASGRDPGKASVRTTHVAVDLAPHPEVLDEEDLVGRE